jgi:hypothetical protein
MWSTPLELYRLTSATWTGKLRTSTDQNLLVLIIGTLEMKVLSLKQVGWYNGILFTPNFDIFDDLEFLNTTHLVYISMASFHHFITNSWAWIHGGERNEIELH